MIDLPRLRQDMRTGRLNRRDFMRMLTAAGDAVTATSGTRPLRAAETPTVYLVRL